MKGLKTFLITLSIVLTSLWFFAAATPLPAYAQVSPPTISASTGSYSSPQLVSISAPAGQIFYTLDGSVPSASSNLFSLPISISAPTELSAVVYQGGVYSPVSTVYLDVDAKLAPILQPGLILRLTSDFGIVSGSGNPESVAEWIDLSGQGNNAVGSVGSQPSFVAKSAGISCVNFNGSSQLLSLPALTNSLSAISAFIVVAPSSPSAGARFFDFGNGALADNIYMSEPSTNAADLHVVRLSTDSSVTSSSAITPGQFQLLEGSYAGNTASISTNGVFGNQSMSMQSSRNVIRTNNFIAQAAAGGNYYSGNIAELLIYAVPLTATQRAAVEAYLINKYRLLAVAPTAPIISVPSGTLSGPTQVAISAQDGATVYVTTDGTTPSPSSSPIYSCPLNVPYSQTIKAIAVLDGAQSGVASATYTLDSTQFPAPNPSDMTAPTINLTLPAPSL